MAAMAWRFLQGPGWLAVLVLAAMVLWPGNAPAGTTVTLFHAFDPETGELQYRGEYAVRQEGSLLHETHVYRDLDGEEVVRVTSTFDLSAMQPVAYHSRDFRNEETIDATVTDGALHYTVQKQDDTEARVMEPLPEHLYFWPNLVHFITANWQTLQSGQPMLANLFVFPLNKSLAMRIDKTGAQQVDGWERVELQLNPDAWLYRVLSDPIRIIFRDGPTPELLEYAGKSAVRDVDGHFQRLRIVFERAHYASANQRSRG